MWTQLKKYCRVSIFAVCLPALYAFTAWAGETAPVKKTPAIEKIYWVRIGPEARTLAPLRDRLNKLPDEIDRDKLRICRLDAGYALAHTGGKDLDTAVLVQEKLIHYLGNTFKTEVATYKREKCLTTAMYLAPRLKSKRPVPPPPPKSQTSSAHLYPDFDPSGWKQLRSTVKTDQARFLTASMVRVLPEVSTQVYLSNMDINRITCMGNRPVKDVVYSDEKGITTKINGSNAFVKLQRLSNRLGNGPEPLKQPVELYVVCGAENHVYTLIGVPRKIPAQWVQLADKTDTLQKNHSLFEGKALEKKLVMLVRQAWRGTYPSSYTVRQPKQAMRIADLQELEITLQRTVDVEGEGLRIKEFTLQLKPGQSEHAILEKQFARPPLSASPLAVSLDSLKVKKGKPTRLFIIEQTGGADYLGKQLPSTS